MELTAENVEKLFSACLSDGGREIEGIITTARLDTTGREADIASLLDQLPDPFKRTGGGGWSFLNACERADGTQWTGLHATMEKLVMLGIASDQVAFLMPRDVWSVFPGGMPYFVVGRAKAAA